MRLNRVVCGGIAGVVGLLAAFLVSEVETRLFGASTHRYFWAAFLGVGGALMWVADWFGLLSPPYSPPSIDVYEKHDAKSDANDPGARVIDLMDIDEL
jgi:hypothetical protein